MRRYDRDLPLFSIHIPKCAGISLHRVLRRWYGDNLYRHYYDEVNAVMPPHRDFTRGISWKRRWLRRKKYRRDICVHGHFDQREHYGLLDYYPDARQCITFVRDPFDIAVSTYFFNKGKGDERFVAGKRRPILAEFKDLADYLEKEELYKPSIIQQFLPFRLEEKTFERKLKQWFIYVGLTEESEASMKQLARHLGHTFIEMPRRNESQWDEAVPSGTREEYLRTHRLEYVLYEYVRAHYLD